MPEEAVTSDVERLEKEAARHRAAQAEYDRERKALVRQIGKLEKERGELQSLLDDFRRIDVEHEVPAPWHFPHKRDSQHHGVVCLFISDAHLDEVVRPEEVEGYNAYNRKIAGLRLKSTVEKTIMLSRDYFTGLKYDGMQLIFGGDMLSGIIHEELAETNEDTALGSLDYWLDPIATAISTLVEEFGLLHVVGVVGNHPRLSRKPRHKLQVRDNLDWLLLRMLARQFKDFDNVTWHIPESPDADFAVYGTRFRLTHGSQFRGGSGIAGMLSPLLLGQHRKTRRAQVMGRPFDQLLMGHWHQYFAGKGLIVNGSIKGYDEFASDNNFEPEPPAQALWVVTPENGISLTAPIYPANRTKERW